jgi:hypothetical protein
MALHADPLPAALAVCDSRFGGANNFNLPTPHMNWHTVFSWIESTALSTWVRESPSMFAFPAVLAVHAIGMGFLVGACAAMDLRLLGFAPRIPVSSTEALLPVIHVGFWLNAISGVLLLIGFPTKHLTNPVFFVKLSLIAAALVDTWLILKHVVRKPAQEGARVTLPGRVLASASLLFWTGSVVSGRLLYYTFTRLNPSGDPF